ncbi:MAG: cytochrome c biogenesis protein CcdA [Blastocatellia bacterium]
MKRRLVAHLALILIILSCFALATFAQSASEVKARGYLSVDGVRPGDKFKVGVAVEIAKGFHIQAHVPSDVGLIATEAVFEPPAGIRLSQPKYPAPKFEKFEFSEGKEYAVHDGTIYIVAEAEAENALNLGPATIRARVTVQACDDRTCLAPSDLDVVIPVNIVAAGGAVTETNANVFAAELIEYSSGGGSSSISNLLEKGSLLSILVGVFLAGLALNLTPCVYPIIPITVGFFVNQSASKLSRTFAMASMYVIGMAITYSALGVVAAKSGGLFGAALQSPVVLITLAAIMIALSLSMFGLYEFKLPESVNRLANSSTQSTSGVFGAFVMGLTMGIVAAPCIGPFVLGLLVHVGTKGSAAYGFMLFFVLALGLGLPYLILGTFSGTIKAMPRSGLWMVTVRKVFGLVLIGMALYFLMPLMGSYVNYVFVAFFAISALYLLFYESGKTKPKQFGWVLRAIGIGAAVVAVMMALPKKIEAEIEWQPYSEQAMQTAQSEGRGVIIDTYADWCIPCKELDHLTFTDANVKQESERFVRLKLDLTSSDANSEAGRAKAKFGIRGVPTVIFLDPAGRERADLRLEGFEKPNLFLARMKQVEFTPGPMAISAADRKSPVADRTAAGSTSASMPSVNLSLLKGGSLSTDSLRGKVTLINFWATWCVPCKAEIPWFNQFDKDYKSRGLEIIGVSLDEEGAAKVKPFLKENSMNYTVSIGDKVASDAFKVDGDKLPVTLLVDKLGRIRFTHVGIAKREEFEAEINQLLNE